ncbi:MAG: glycosaminoglycan attachment protein [Bacteroidales bacterium]|nr:glycosaminoglycan attachment protein [Bacteroidales bacterium]
MKRINQNRGNIHLLFTRDPLLTLFHEEMEYFTSDDERLLGVVLRDKVDSDCYHAILLDRKLDGKYAIVNYSQDNETIGRARQKLSNMMNEYEYPYPSSQVTQSVFFNPVVKENQEHPSFKELRDNPFFAAAKRVIDEISFHFNDKDNNFVDQFQSQNGFDARVWELYLKCYLREEGFDFEEKYAVPDFIVEKGKNKVGIEAVTVSEKDKKIQTDPYDIKMIQEALKNDVPLMFGSPLYTKVKHTCENSNYWNLPQMKDVPFMLAIADFHGIMSMTWTFPAIVSALYGIDQTIEVDENNDPRLKTINGLNHFKKNGTTIPPLFFSKDFENVSAVLFSPCGTISKFNRMGVQAGFGIPGFSTLVQIKTCYNHLENAFFPNLVMEPITEESHETWADGIQIFHNPLAVRPLDHDLFPLAGHHFYKDGQLYSQIPKDHVISTTTFNISGNPKVPYKRIDSKNVFVDVSRQWNL